LLPDFALTVKNAIYSAEQPGYAMDEKQTKKDHFKGKDALRHIIEVQANGVMASTEIHGAETPGSVFAALDSARDITVSLLILHLVLHSFNLTRDNLLLILMTFGIALMLWKAGRSAWLAWSRLERLHRIVLEEQREIQENRPQEREELKELYRLKGYEGKLLDEVIDVLMADSDRLLRVMLQEEMGFRLEENEHPLVQGLGALIGAFFGGLIPIIGYYYFAEPGIVSTSLISLALFAGLSAWRERNRVVPAVVWNIGIAIFAYATAYYCIQFIM
jgi:hypothetical protein